jgi:RsiW-degrading membrane proteinase PrsW (M82 family)
MDRLTAVPSAYRLASIQVVSLLPPLATIVMGFIALSTHKEEPFSGTVQRFLYTGLVLGFVSLILAGYLLFYSLASPKLGSGW